MFSTTRMTGLAAVFLAATSLSGCGTAPGDRALSGGLLGAGTGAVLGSITGSAGTGALVGGLGGMAIGALTSPNAINLGTPPWNRTAARRTTTRTAASTTTRTAQNCTTKETQTQRITTCKK